MTREEAIHVLKEISATLKSWSGFTKYPQAIDTAIEALQAEPVVRCKDCIHWNSETKGCKRNPSVEAWQEDDYCSYGERKD